MDNRIRARRTRQADVQQAKKRPCLRVGPGTLLAATVGAAILYSQVTRPQPSLAGAGQVVYEADAQGHLRRVAAPALPLRQAPPLWKPEAGLLLAQNTPLNLRPDQRKALQALNTKWLRAKTVLEQQMKRAAGDAGTMLEQATPEHGVAPATVAGSLSDYSRLSAQYDQQRGAYWAQATAMLTPAQLRQVDAFRQSAGKRR